MSRRHAAEKREITIDPKFQSAVVSKFMNAVMYDGKKSVAEGIVYGALEIVREKTGRDPVEVMQDAVQALTPHLEVRSRRVGGATYQVPVEVPGRRARTLAIRWLVSFSRDRREKVMAERLGAEMLDALAGQGGAFKKKDDIFRMAQANKAFAHYRW